MQREMRILQHVSRPLLCNKWTLPSRALDLVGKKNKRKKKKTFSAPILLFTRTLISDALF